MFVTYALVGQRNTSPSSNLADIEVLRLSVLPLPARGHLVFARAVRHAARRAVFLVELQFGYRLSTSEVGVVCVWLAVMRRVDARAFRDDCCRDFTASTLSGRSKQ